MIFESLSVMYNAYIIPHGVQHDPDFLTHDFIPLMLNALGLVRKIILSLKPVKILHAGNLFLPDFCDVRATTGFGARQFNS